MTDDEFEIMYERFASGFTLAQLKETLTETTMPWMQVFMKAVRMDMEENGGCLPNGEDDFGYTEFLRQAIARRETETGITSINDPSL